MSREAPGTKSGLRGGRGVGRAEGRQATVSTQPLICFSTSGSAKALSTLRTRSRAAAQGTTLKGLSRLRGAIFRPLCPSRLIARLARVAPPPTVSRPRPGRGLVCQASPLGRSVRGGLGVADSCGGQRSALCAPVLVRGG